MKLLSGLFVVIFSLFFLKDNTDELSINHIQVIGSHNSYKRSIDPELFKVVHNADSAAANAIDYSHIGISEQLNLGLLNLEIDIYADSKGGKYAHPKGLDWAANQSLYDTSGVMKGPGFKVFHIQDIDFRSNCFTFKQCLVELREWSAAHKDHFPVFITINAKDEVIDRPGFTIPEKFTAEVFDELDKTIVENLGRENLIVPDEIRGKYKTLEQAVLAGHWPALKIAKGKFIFILDETGEKIADYIKGHSSLKNRILFANADPGTPEAAILIRNNPKKDSISVLVKKGYIVRTRADADTREARMNDQSTFEAACRSGAQIITTDYYQKSTHFLSDYFISFPDGKYFRVNPLFKK